ncbi:MULTISPECIES: hypothetical protein [unclassified Chryseobacterium]|uniref:hypothetical protein n=1 Tax=unclassified Chryseobacterium TaxID=2593645 RepID=UPI00100B26DB|nr:MULTISPECIES: hypothetical protein [unclassified Chryseobacterium]RXM49803.1 hypothetical protein BOQ64_21215 [Chryseobacterium sp. CH25]RXM61953.1 hypothetical protein BOQ60_21990 [Chryseobacterium sp. CH1]
MKKIFLGLAFGLGVLTSAQQYPNNGWGDDGYYQNGNGYYSDEDDRNYFPDDYYYNYPQDYYPGDYYQSYYNDYRNSIINIDWNGFFIQNRLNRWQVDQIIRLNNLYANFTAWDNFYRFNPDRWYYDRFYALERIMGPRVFIVFQNNYYRGASPIIYFQNYRRTYYVPRYTVMPRYRNVNINIYRVDRSRFRRVENPTFDIVRGSSRPNNGFGNSGSSSGGFRNSGGFRGNSDNGGFRNNNSGGFRGNSDNGGFRGNSDNGGFRNGNSGGFRENSNSGGFRGNSDNGGSRNNNGGFRGSNEVRREAAPSRENNGGFRGGSGGFRQQRSENSSPSRGNSGGFRGSLVRN